MISRSILIVDDEQSIRTSLEGALEDEGYQVKTVSSGQEALDSIKEAKPDVILLDIWMPGMDGLEVLTRIKEDQSNQVVIMMSGHGTIETAVKATKAGAYDFIEKPLSLEKLLVTIQNACETDDLKRENIALRQQVKKQNIIVGSSPAMQEIHELVQRVAPTTGSVLITGENGTGKELVAQSIHALSPRYGKPFVDVNCAAIPEELIESHLFGHERGAFTGATQQKRGKFDLANTGTLFLDEIGDMSLKTQAKILRILQEQKFERLGGSQTLTVDVRIVAATNKDLQEEIKKGNFREDLFYRLNVVPFHVPPLRNRKEDIPELAAHFLRHFTEIHGKKPRSLNQEAPDVLLNYAWPGNVRELKNLIERLVILTTESRDGTDISPGELLEHIQGAPSLFQNEAATEAGTPFDRILSSNTKLRDARQEFEREFIVKILKEQDGNISKTASILGIERSHLHKKIKSYGIEV